MIRVAFLPLDLQRWDGARADALCLPIFADDRPLRGAAGLADWRLCGALSRCILRGRVHGEAGEVLMVAASGRLPFARVLVFGLGGFAGFGETRYRAACRRIREVVAGLGARAVAVAPPGRAREAIPPRRALEILLDEIDGLGDIELLVVEAAAAQKDMAGALRQRRA